MLVGLRTPELVVLIVMVVVLALAAAVAFSAGRAMARAGADVGAGSATGAAATGTVQSSIEREEQQRMASGTFATAINCIDGRAQQPVAEWVKSHCGVTYVDVATIPGPDLALTKGDEERKGHIHEYVSISVNAHGSRVVAVAGHHGCAAYDASRDEHIASIREAVKVVAGWSFPAPVRVVGLWVNDQWQVEVVADTEKEAM